METHESWVRYELDASPFCDKRLFDRFVTMVEDFARHPTASVPTACRTNAAAKAAYRFWDNPRVAYATIRASHVLGTVARIRDAERMLIVQDTTELDFSSHPATDDLGYLSHPALRGLMVHSSLAVSAGGVPQGLIHQEVWTRPPSELGKRQRRHQRPLEEKESRKWVTATRAIEAALPPSLEAVIVADQEADMYALLAEPRREGLHLLVRGARNRCVVAEEADEEEKLWERIESVAPQGQLAAAVGRRQGQPPRRACLCVRFTSVRLLPPGSFPKDSPVIPVQVILVREESAPEGVSPIRWLLLTTLPVETVEQAVQCVRWYSCRWLIERYHYVLKSGCRIEELQLETAKRLERALATYAVVAWRLLWLTYRARECPDASCEEALTIQEWQTLYCLHHRTPTPTESPPTLRDAVRWIAQMGGFLARKGDGEPGVKTLWRGWHELQQVIRTLDILQNRARDPQTGCG